MLEASRSKDHVWTGTRRHRLQRLDLFIGEDASVMNLREVGSTPTGSALDARLFDRYSYDMQAFRVWSIWKDDPGCDQMTSGAFELQRRAQELADRANVDHRRMTGFDSSSCRYIVREETVPRDIVFDGKPDRVVMVFLGEDENATDVSQDFQAP